MAGIIIAKYKIILDTIITTCRVCLLMIKRNNEILYSMYARVSLVQQVIVRITAIAETILCQWNLLVHDTIMATQYNNKPIKLPHGWSHDLSHDLQFLRLATLYNAI